MIRNFRRRNPKLEIPELWHRLKKKGYTRQIKSLYRIMKKDITARLNAATVKTTINFIPVTAFIPAPI